MNKVIPLVALGLFILGVFQSFQTASFQRRAIVVSATVVSVEERKGPPKPRQKTPLHVIYRLDDGREHSAVTHLPMLQEIRQGDSIRLLVDPSRPNAAELPLWSELWARPLTYLIGAGLLWLVGRVLRGKHLR
jgi:hypothetical protein